MGLDTVELVIDIENEFSIEISDKDAETLGIVGDIARYVEAQTKNTHHAVTFDMALRKIIEILESQYGIPQGKVNSMSHVVFDLGLD